METKTEIINANRLKEFFRFCLVGIIATAIHYGTYILLDRWMNVNIAYTVGYLCSLCCNLWLTAHFTFKQNVTILRAGGFLASHAINYLLHILLLNLFLWLGCSDAVAPVPVFCIVVPVNFILVRFVFKKIK
ncbi:MAG: GtrA family protein [Paludibacteraceae bacterium]|nr:GtrA family protein [Paludibacteraceae bacterium]